MGRRPRQCLGGGGEAAEKPIGGAWTASGPRTSGSDSAEPSNVGTDRPGPMPPEPSTVSSRSGEAARTTSGLWGAASIRTMGRTVSGCIGTAPPGIRWTTLCKHIFMTPGEAAPTTSGQSEARTSAMVHWDGTGWNAVPSVPIESHLNGIWGSGPDDVWAVGGEWVDDVTHLVAIFHWDGTSWTQVLDLKQAPAGTEELLHVWGSGPSDVWAVGLSGTILHWDGGRLVACAERNDGKSLRRVGERAERCLGRRWSRFGWPDGRNEQHHSPLGRYRLVQHARRHDDRALPGLGEQCHRCMGGRRRHSALGRVFVDQRLARRARIRRLLRSLGERPERRLGRRKWRHHPSSRTVVGASAASTRSSASRRARAPR